MPSLTMTHTRMLRILAVDDDPLCLKLLCRIIILLQPLYQDISFVITTFHSAEEALKNLTTATYDLIFTDIEMGGMPGYEMARIIRNQSPDSIYIKNHDIPIYAITARYTTKSIEQYKEAGITQTFEKPVKKDSIHRLIKDRINQIE